MAGPGAEEDFQDDVWDGQLRFCPIALLAVLFQSKLLRGCAGVPRSTQAVHSVSFIALTCTQSESR